MIMIGSGAIGTQPLLPVKDLPGSQVLVSQPSVNGTGVTIVASAVPSVAAKKAAGFTRYSTSVPAVLVSMVTLVLLAGMSLA
jgi:hypothetical protein